MRADKPDDEHAGRMDRHLPGSLESQKNNKVRITIHLDRDVIGYFKSKSTETAKRYQTLINEALREYTGLTSKPGVITDLIRRVKRLEKELLRRHS